MKKFLGPILIFLLTAMAAGCGLLTSPLVQTTPTTTADGFNSITTNGITFSWRVTANATLLEIKLSAPTNGWVACGFANSVSPTMQNADIYICKVESGVASVRDDHSISSLPFHAADTTNHAVVNQAQSSESSGTTTIGFTRPLNSGDNQDIALTSGTSYSLMLAYGSSDDISVQHATHVRTSITI